MALRARRLAWLRYWRSLVWWQGPRCNGPLTPLESFLNLSSPGRTESSFSPRRTEMRTDEKLWRNRKAKKELARRLQSENPGLEVVHPHAAGIDVGNRAHYVAVRPHRYSQPVLPFERLTAHLLPLAERVQVCRRKNLPLPPTADDLISLLLL